MKKIIALVLALALALGCALAMAEGADKPLETIKINDTLTLQGVLPEGYAFDASATEVIYGVSFGGKLVKADDPEAPVMLISVELNDTYAPGTRMNDLSEEQLKELEATFTEDNDVKIEYLETAHGTKVMKVTEAGDDPDWLDIFSVYESYDIELLVAFPQDAKNPVMTDEILQMAMQFLSDLDFVKAE